MRYVPRKLGRILGEASRHFPTVVVTGPRRAGKTTLLRKLFPRARYVLLEDPDIQARVRNDPRGFLEELDPPVVFNEIQNAPNSWIMFARSLMQHHIGWDSGCLPGRRKPH